MEEATCERIIKTVDNILRKDPILDEFDIIYSPGEINKSPIVHIDHKLALESWCVKYIYKHAYSSIFLYRNNGGYENLCALIRWTQLCLLIMPEVSTFWNIRKKMIKRNQLEVNADIVLTKLIITRKPKCIEAFQHRRWLFDCMLAVKNENCFLQEEISNNNYSIYTPEYLHEFLLSELQLCTWAASRKENNYHAWNHRLWVLDHLSNSCNVVEIYKREYTASHEWLSYHVSEHSGMHYYIKLLDKITAAYERELINIENLDNDFKNVEILFKKELNFNKELMALYPGHESLFYSRRVLLFKLYTLMGNKSQKASPPPPALKRSCIEILNADWNIIIQSEIDMVQDNKCFPEQHKLTEQHLNWVKNVMAY